MMQDPVAALSMHTCDAYVVSALLQPIVAALLQRLNVILDL